MISLPGYKPESKLFENEDTLILKAVRSENGETVTLKLLKEAYPLPEELARFRHEFKIAHGLKIEGIVHANKLVKHENTLFIEYEYFSGVSLNRLIRQRHLSQEEFLQIAIDTVDIMGKIHASQLIHKDINPSNILYNPRDHKLKIIDFGISSILAHENPIQKSPTALEGTLAYVSPEQTGRMNRLLDYRSDYYSLGATFYEMLCEKPPFDSEDPLEVIHAHIARKPTEPHIRNPRVHEAISDIVMKLLSKNAEERYQSARGIKMDLEECKHQLKSFGKITPFSLGRNDTSDRFRLIQKLYGRQQQIEQLMEGFERIRTGGHQVFMVAGYSGVGKTRLIREVHKHIALAGGIFLSGRFGRYGRDIPYRGFVDAFKDLARQLLGETSESLNQWRNKLLETLGPNGRVITDVVPEMERILGPQPPIPELSPTEAQNRFNLVIQKFIRVSCDRRFPLVMFFDDLQWADSASLGLLERILSDKGLSHFLFIGTFRDNEVGPAHPLTATMDTVEEKDVPIQAIFLKPLKLDEVTELISDALNTEPERALALARIVIEKTGGNPFFTEIFLKSLHSENLLTYNPNSGKWQWNQAQIQVMGITENVVELLSSKIKRFDQKTGDILKAASCIGIRFNLRMLVAIRSESLETITEAIKKLVAEGFLVPLGDAYKIVGQDMEILPRQLTVEFMFSHERVQNVAYSLLSEKERIQTHLNIGYFLKNNVSEENEEENLFEIVNHLNMAIELISESDLKKELAILNMKAGRKAKASAAFEPSFTYFLAALRLTGPEGWELDYEQCLALHIEAAEAAYLCAEYGQMNCLAEMVLEKARDLLDKVRVYEVIIEAQKAQYQLVEAVQTAVPVLDMLGVRFPKKRSTFRIFLSLTLTKLILGGIKIERLVKHKKLRDPVKRAAMRVIATTGSAAYFVAPDLMPFLVFKGVRYSVRFGNSPASAIPYAAYGIVQCGVLKDIETGYRFGNLALNIIEHFNAVELKTKVTHLVNAFIKHWKDPVRDTLPALADGFYTGLDNGDFEYAGYCAFFNVYHSFVAGRNLRTVSQDMDKYAENSDQIMHETPLQNLKLFQQVVANLKEPSENPHILEGKFFSVTKMLPVLEKARDKTTLFNVYFSMFYMGCIFGKFEQATEYSDQIRKYMDAAAGIIGMALFYFYESLILLAQYKDLEPARRKEALKRVRSNLKRLKRWSHHAPMNHLHKYYLVEAALAGALSNHHRAADFFDKAMQSARQNKYKNDEALANELCARYYLERGKTNIARAYLMDARYCYLRWGANSKVRQLETLYQMQLNGGPAKRRQNLLRTATNKKNTTFESGDTFDLVSVMKVSQTISKEIVLEKLLPALIKIVVENAGAQSGYLILQSRNELFVEAEGGQRNEDFKILHSMPLEEHPHVPASIVHYAARTGEHVVLNDAAHEGPFTNDPHVRARRIKSVLCLPIIFKSRLTGILYLENNLTVEAFTPERLEILKLLSSQIATSIENARLYSTLEESELRYRELYNNIVDMVILIDDTDRVIMANPKFFRTIGMEPKQNSTVPFKRWIHSEDVRAVEESLLDKLHEGEEIKDFSFRLQNRGGQIIEVECSAKSIKRDEQLIGYQMVIRDITERKRLEKKLIHSIQEAESARSGTILGLAKLAEYRDEDTGAHLERIREYAKLIAIELGKKPQYREYITDEYVGDIYFSSILHDIGKVGIPDSILLKPGRLSKEEFEIIKRHPVIGGDVLKQVNEKVEGRSFLTIGMHIAYFHHEKWNGKGYPKGLKRTEIPLSARIVALVDVYDALTSKRIYKDAYSHERARDMIVSEKGEHFDPEVVDAFVANEEEFDRIRKEMHEEHETYLLEEFTYFNEYGL